MFVQPMFVIGMMAIDKNSCNTKLEINSLKILEQPIVGALDAVIS